MRYYITENEICKHVTNEITDVNKWLKKHNKTINKIYVNDLDGDCIVEVK